MKKRILSLALALVLVLSMIPAAFAADTVIPDGASFEQVSAIEEGTVYAYTPSELYDPIASMMNVFIVYANTPVTTRGEALAKIEAMGLIEVAESEKAAVFVMCPVNGEGYSAADYNVVYSLLTKLNQRGGIMSYGQIIPKKTYLFGEGKGADFIAEYLTNDVMSGSIAANVLFGAKSVPAEKNHAVPAYLINCSDEVVEYYKTINETDAVTTTDETAMNLTVYYNSGYVMDGGYTPKRVIVETVPASEFTSAISESAWNVLCKRVWRDPLNTSLFDGSDCPILDRPIAEELDMTFNEVLNDDTELTRNGRWYEWVPNEVYETMENGTGETYPLIVVYHGNGDHEIYEAESNGWVELAGGIRAIVVAPRDNYEAGFPPESAANRYGKENAEFIRNVICEKYPVDMSRIYCAGFSIGGFTVAETVAADPSLFAGAAAEAYPADGYLEIFPYDEYGGDADAEAYDIPFVYHAGMNDGGNSMKHPTDSSASKVLSAQLFFNQILKFNNMEDQMIDLVDFDYDWFPGENDPKTDKTTGEVTGGYDFWDGTAAQYICQNLDFDKYPYYGYDFTAIPNTVQTTETTPEGIEYTKNVWYNDEGMPMLQHMVMGDMGHNHYTRYAKIIWDDIFSHYSRDTETGALIYADAVSSGVTVTTATAKDKTGEYGQAYQDAGYKATFGYKDTSGKEVEYVKLEINAIFYTADDVAAFAEEGYPRTSSVTPKTAYEYRTGMMAAFNNAPGAEKGVTGYYEMEKDANGVYSVSLPLPPQAYNYRYRVKYADEDVIKVLDPANPSPSNPNTGENVEFSMFYVGSAEDAPENMKNFYPVDAEYQGTVTYTSVVASNGKTQDIGIYLPYNYDASKTYKVVYASHGSTGDEVEWFSLGSLANIMDNLVKDGKISDTIVVTMNNNAPFDNLANLVEVAKNVADVLVPYMEKNYPVSTNVCDRAVFGLSAGASMATNLLQTIPEEFGYVGISSVGRSFPLENATADLEDIKNTVVAVYSGALDFRTPSSKKIADEVAALGGVCTFKIMDGAHDWTSWSEAIEDFLTNVIWEEQFSITEAAVYTATVKADGITAGDITGLITTIDGTPAFADKSGVATAVVNDGIAVITIDASKISGINFNGTSGLYINGVLIGNYVIPELTVDSQLFGSAYTNGKSTLKLYFNERLDYDEDSRATLKLELDGLDNSLIDSSNAKVILDQGDGYYPEEYTFLATALENAWINGETTYALKQGDLEMDTQGYLTADANSGREWSTLGGDGAGNYYYNLTVGGITYNGLPVADQTFVLHIHIYGNDHSGASASAFADVKVEAIKGESRTSSSAEPVWTFQGKNDIPVLCDYYADNFYVTWPSGTDASGITADDVTITLYSQYGDTKTLTRDDFTVFASAGETQIAITYINWAFVPVYNTMTISVNGIEKTYDIASVYVYEAQQGGGGVTIDGTVTVYSFYGLKQEDVFQIMNPSSYTLSATVDGAVKYYAEDADGNGILVDNAADAKVFDGNGPEDQNIQLIGNSNYVTTRKNATAEKMVNGEAITFTKNYSGGRMKTPSTCDQSLEALPGYIIPWGTTNWITNEKCLWQPGVDEGWTGIKVTPNKSRNGYTADAGTTVQFEADNENALWKIVGDPTSADTTLDENGLLTIGVDETGFFGVCAYIEGDPYMQGTIHVTAKAPASTISGSTVTAKCGEGETAVIDVIYNGSTDATSVRFTLDTELDIINATSSFDMEYNQANGKILVWNTDGITDGDVICSITLDLDVSPWLKKGEYKLPIKVIEATNGNDEAFIVGYAPATLIIDNGYLQGDVNCDGIISNADLVELARYLVDLTELSAEGLVNADYNGDGEVSNVDLVMIARYLVA